MALTVVGIFENAGDAQRAVDTLVSNGFDRSNIDVSNVSGGTDTGYGSGSAVPDRHANTSGTMAEEVVDDAKDVGSGIGDFFRSLFGSDDNDDYARRYSTVADRSSVLTVHSSTREEAERAADLLDECGAVNVDEKATQYGYTSGNTFSGDTTGYTADQTSLPTADNTGQTMQVIQENLQVGKREVETGGVRLRSRIVERPVEENVRLRQERVVVQRNPVNRPASTADLNAFQEGTVELTERSEVPVVSKTAQVVEEISLGKEVTERDEIVRDTVRNTEVDVEQIGGDRTAQTGTTGYDQNRTDRRDPDNLIDPTRNV